ncbi:MAG: hypothetical protein Q9201_006010 [Fulgogasparrea decipioides]
MDVGPMTETASQHKYSASDIETWIKTHPNDPFHYIGADEGWMNENRQYLALEPAALAPPFHARATVKRRTYILSPLDSTIAHNRQPKRPKLAPASGNSMSQPGGPAIAATMRHRRTDTGKENRSSQAGSPSHNRANGTSPPSPERGAKEAQDLIRNIKSDGDGPAIVTNSVRGRVIDHLVDLGIETENTAAKKFVRCKSKAPTRELEDDIMVFRSIVNIAKAAMVCCNQQLSEPYWNCAVHFPLLKVASEAGDRNQLGITFYDMTTPRINNKSLLPIQAATSKTNKGTMVDFALALDPGDNILKRIEEWLKDGTSEFSVNHTDTEYLRFKPISNTEIIKVKSENRAKPFVNK